MKFLTLILLVLFSVTACKTTDMKDGAQDKMTEKTMDNKVEENNKSTTTTIIELSPMPTSAEAIESTNILFGYDKDSVDDKHGPILNAIASLLKKDDKSTVTITGHSDDRVSSEYNLALGKRRAESVKNALVERGVNATRLTVGSHGEKHQRIPDADSKIEYHLNRRVTFKVQ